ncbi:unnamed protein product, partial [Porites lobata]
VEGNKDKSGQKKGSVESHFKKSKKAISEETQRISAELVAEITAPLNLGNAQESDSIESSTFEESDDETWGCVVEQERPQVGMKTPKSSFPPRKCINVHCNDEKKKMKKEISLLKQEIEDLKSSTAGTAKPNSYTVLTPSGPMDANEASRRGFAEIAEGVWCCAIKVKALINSVLSRTALACAMLTIFYPRDDLSGKRLSELDRRIVNAIAEFAVVAKVTEREPKPPKEGEVPKQKKTVTKRDVMQALRQKCNQLIFQTNRPSYHKGN